MKKRVERDSMGEVEVDSSSMWGAQTQRSLSNFKISEERFPLEFLHALAACKKACAEANSSLGNLKASYAKAIIKAADEVLEKSLDDQFPLVIWQTGSGTQTNMNMNEVIANQANIILNGDIEQRTIHPNDHVNKGQSSNDIIPTAMHVSLAIAIRDSLIPAIKELIGVLSEKEKEFENILKVGRTHLMDATPVDFGKELGAFRFQLEKCEKRIKESVADLKELPIGGTAVGSGLNCPDGFPKLVVDLLGEHFDETFFEHENLMAGSSHHDPIVSFSGQCKTLAITLFKFANDVAWYSSGPRCGLGEVTIPANEPGSSIMPGKVNPTQAEALKMVCAQTFGLDGAIAFAGSQGNFQLNVFKPMLIYNSLFMVRTLSDAMISFSRLCLKGMEPNKKQCKVNLDKSLMLVTALAPEIGYEKAASVAKEAFKSGKTLKEVVLEKRLLSEEKFDRLINPADMV